MVRKLAAEFIGTAWLVLGGCGSAVLAAAFPQLGIGFVGVSIAFGLTVLTMAYAIGHVSGCHLNPAVSVGLWAGGRFKAGELLPYIVTPDKLVSERTFRVLLSVVGQADACVWVQTISFPRGRKRADFTYVDMNVYRPFTVLGQGADDE